MPIPPEAPIPLLDMCSRANAQSSPAVPSFPEGRRVGFARFLDMFLKSVHATVNESGSSGRFAHVGRHDPSGRTHNMSRPVASGSLCHRFGRRPRL